MLSPLRNRFGIPGVISVIALVFAMLGGAYAASNSGSGKATASAKAKRGPKGPKGATGPAGPAGPQGPAGANGKDGSNGANGSNGAAGATGPTGAAGATGTAGATGAAGAAGAKGATGATGAAGLSGFTATLPSEETETGAWSYSKTETKGHINVTASFAIPLAAPISKGNTHYIYKTGKEIVENPETEELEEVESEECNGTAAAPSAEPGNFCMYVAAQTGALDTNFSETGIYTQSNSITDPSFTLPVGGGTGPTGAHLVIELSTGSSEGWGTWAVTAP
jgi:hypothetical protein